VAKNFWIKIIIWGAPKRTLSQRDFPLNLFQKFGIQKVRQDRDLVGPDNGAKHNDYQSDTLIVIADGDRI